MRYVLFVFLILPLVSVAQSSVFFYSGYGTYAMKDLKAFQERLERSFLVPLKNVSSFPGYANFEGGFNFQTQSALFYGIRFGYASTGARGSYSDYSGSLATEQLVRCYALTASVGVATRYPNNLQLNLDLRPGLIFTDYELTADQKIDTNESHEEYQFKSTNVAVQPTLSLHKRYGSFEPFVQLGYNINVVRGKLTLKDNHDAYLQDDSGNKIPADWSGLRVGLGIAYVVEY